MMNFQDWLVQKEIEEGAAVGLPTQSPPKSIQAGHATAYTGKRPKGANKQQVMSYWQSLRPSNLIPMQPIRADHKGSTYSQDGIRITGSRQFIDSVISRLKDIMSLDGQGVNLEVVYREIESQQPQEGHPEAFVFYVMVKQKPIRPVKVGKPSTKPTTEINKAPLIKPAGPVSPGA